MMGIRHYWVFQITSLCLLPESQKTQVGILPEALRLHSTALSSARPVK